MALSIELSTIPPYLSALYSVRDRTSAAARLIRDVVIGEMLHMVLVSNLMNAIGAHPSLAPEFVPLYPGYMPHLAALPDADDRYRCAAPSGGGRRAHGLDPRLLRGRSWSSDDHGLTTPQLRAHLQGPTVGDWPLNLFDEQQAEAELPTLRAIAASDIHNLAVQSEGDHRIIPATPNRDLH